MLPDAHHRLVRRLYLVTVFVSAALLFAVQPMFTKMVLPRLGGAPAVWSVAMVFFQTTLLAGYAFAHALIRLARPRLGLALHLAVMIAALFTLPLAIAKGWSAAPQTGEALWLLGLFAASIGLPFFALSANGPLLQAWFARTDHPAAARPYFLYAASNVGSFLALIAYPFAVEPFTHLGQQTWAWSVVFGLLIGLIAACGAISVRSRATSLAADGAAASAAPAPSSRDALIWMGLAAVPSGLLVAVTAHISTDIGAVPLLWVVPLALYLVTFVIVFQDRPILPHKIVVLVQPVFIIGLTAALIFQITHLILWMIALNLAAFFITALVCHGELAKRRPPAEHLTAFYMWMSAGGMIGGLCAALVAPLLFSWIAEYPILIVLAILCRPGFVFPFGRREWTLIVCAVALAAYLAIPAIGFGFHVEEQPFKIIIGSLLVLALVVEVLRWNAPLAFASLIAISFMLFRLYEPSADRRETVRSFFGVLKLTDSSDGEYRMLLHGTTIHGVEKISDIEAADPQAKPEPLSYYHANSGLARALSAARWTKGGPIHVAVVGLGTGSLACYAEPEDTWNFYEIDSAVVRISRELNRFTFVSRCTPQAPIIMGDARLKLAEAPDGQYDFIAVDAFSSDTIPVHLLTREAMQVYLQKLAPHGTVALHVSNRHLELASVVAGIAEANGLVARVHPRDDDSEQDNDSEYKYTSTVVVVARTQEDFGALGDPAGWPIQESLPGQWVWTDDYSNIVGAIIRHLKD